MRQSNGTDILGDNDPRSVTIGIIDVSPDDEREHVLAAILTQEKLARQVIVVVLPAQNKAFQRPVDFDGLKNMRRTLKAQLVLIVPQGSGPAEFARQRRFTFFWSLEAYAQSLRTGQQAVQPSKKGWPFWRKGQPQLPDNAPVPQVPPSPMPPVSGVEQFPVVATSIAPHTDEILQPQRMLVYTDEQGDVAAQDTNATMELPDEMFEDEDITNKREEAFDPDKTQPRSKKKNTSAAVVPVVEPQPMILIPHAPRILHVPQDSRSIQASPPVGTGNTRSGGTGKVVAARSTFWTQLSATRRRWLFVLLILLLLLIIGGGVYTALSVFGTEVTATITITPISKTVQNMYPISAVTGGANMLQSQVEARFLSSTLPAQSKTIAASGHGTSLATYATGTLTFYNALSTQQTLPANTLVSDAAGIQVVTDESVVVPPAVVSPPVAQLTAGSAIVNAHTINTGTMSNILANDFSNMQCCGSGISVGNAAAFSGGQDPQAYTYIEQSDIDSATNQLSSTLSQRAQTGVMGQILPNERLISPISCVPNVTSNQSAGDKVANVTVTVIETCTGEVYDQQQARTIAQNVLQGDAKTHYGASYALSGGITTAITRTVLVDKTGKISLFVKAGGVWVYQFSDAQKRQLARQIVGKSEKDALALLAATTGVQRVSVQVNGGDGNTLPGDTQHITVVVTS